MKAVKITNSFFEVGPGGNSEEKFAGGSVVPLNADSQRQVDLRNGEIIDVPDDADKAASDAAKAQAKADAAAADAAAKADAATAAAAITASTKIKTPAKIVAEVTFDAADQK